MIVGVPKEIKSEEYRVGLVPSSVRELVKHGHQVVVETNAGLGSSYSDDAYRAYGAEILETAAAVFDRADMIVKVKEPLPPEYDLLKEDQVLFTYLHLAPNPELTAALLKAGCVAIAYETVTSVHGDLPLLSPMSQVAGRLSLQVGCSCLQKFNGGSGVLLGGVPGVYPGQVVVIGGGVVGTHALRMAIGKEAWVTVLDRSLKQLQHLDLQFGAELTTLYATEASIAEQVAKADLVVGAVLVPGKSAPSLVTRDMLKTMKPGSVIVDVAIDQGGCCETSRPTSHSEPTYVEEGVIHYCVTNMPGAVPHTSSAALNNATLPYVERLANEGYRDVLSKDMYFREGLNVCRGHVTHQAVSTDLGYAFHDPMDLLQL